MDKHVLVLSTIEQLIQQFVDFYVVYNQVPSGKHPTPERRNPRCYARYLDVNDLWHKARTLGSLVSDQSEDHFWLSMSLTNGDCGVFAIALHQALKAQGIESTLLVNSEQDHAALLVDGIVYDALCWSRVVASNDVGCSLGQGTHFSDEYLFTSFEDCCKCWIPYDNLGTAICNAAFAKFSSAPEWIPLPVPEDVDEVALVTSAYEIVMRKK